MKCALALLLCVAVASGAPRQKRHCAHVAVPRNATFEEKLRHFEGLGIYVREDREILPFQEFSAIVFQFQMPSEEDLEPFKFSKLIGMCKEGAEEGSILKDLCGLYRTARPFAEAAKKRLKLPLASAFKVPGVHRWNSSSPTCDELAGPFNTAILTSNLYNTSLNNLATCSLDKLRAHEVFVSYNSSSDLSESFLAFRRQFENTFNMVDGQRRKWKNETEGSSIEIPITDVLLKTLDGWTYTDAVAEVQRWKEAAAACSQGKLPTSLISLDLWTAELAMLSMVNSTKLLVEDLYNAYEDSRLVACAVKEGKLVVKAIVPVRNNNKVWKAVEIWSKNKIRDGVEGNTSCCIEELLQESTFAVGNSEIVEIENRDLLAKVPEDTVLKNKCAYSILKQIYLEGGDEDVSYSKFCKWCKLNCEV